MLAILRRLSKIINPDSYRDVVRWQQLLAKSAKASGYFA